MFSSQHPDKDYNFLNSINKNFIGINLDEYVRPYLDSLEIKLNELTKNKELLSQRNIEIRAHNAEIDSQMSILSREIQSLQNQPDDRHKKDKIKTYEDELKQLSNQIQSLFDTEEINDEDLAEIKADVNNIITNFDLIKKLYETYTLNENKTIYNDDNLNKMKESFYKIYGSKGLSLEEQISKGKELSSIQDCFAKLCQDINKLKTSTSQNKKYYQGLHDSWTASLKYWLWGSVAWTYNWCSYKTISIEYSKFERENVLALNSLIENRKYELGKAQDFFKLTITRLETFKNRLDNDFKISKLESIIRSVNGNIVTIFELLRVPQ